MQFIAHRGNINGPNQLLENSPDYILNAAEHYDVEIDVWFIDNTFFLGHDVPTYKVDLYFLSNPKFWCHAKTLSTLSVLLDNNINCFFHDTDYGVLTASGHIWTFPGNDIYRNSIAVMPELYKDWDYTSAWGYCSDFREGTLPKK